MKTYPNKTSRPFFPPLSSDKQTLQVNVFHDLDNGPEDHVEIDMSGREQFQRIRVKTVVHSSASSVDKAQATASMLRRQSFQAIDQMMESLVDRPPSQSIMSCLAELKEEADFGIAKLTKNREIERLEGNAAEILRCIRDCVTLTPAEEFCRPAVVRDIRDTLQKLKAKAVIEPLDVKAFRSSLRQRKLPFNKLLFALKEEVNKYDYAAAQIDDPNADEVQQ